MATFTSVSSFSGTEDSAISISFATFKLRANESSDINAFKLAGTLLGTLQIGSYTITQTDVNNGVWFTSSGILVKNADNSYSTYAGTALTFTPPADASGALSPFSVTGASVTTFSTTPAFGAASTSNLVKVNVNVAGAQDAGTIAVSGSVTQGQPVTATVADKDGINSSVTYKWQVKDGNTWVDITGATQASFTPDNSQAGKEVRAVATYTDGLGKLETLTSVAQTVANTNDAGSVSITGDATKGGFLSAVVSDPDGVPDTGISYQWQVKIGADWVNINGANSKDFQLTSAQVGREVRVTVGYDDKGGFENTATSAASATVSNANTVGSVSISGTAEQGATLSANLNDEDAPTAVTYQWQMRREGGQWEDIDGATAQDFVPGQQHVGKELQVVVSYTDTFGQAILTTAPVGPVENVNDAPVISSGATGTVAENADTATVVYTATSTDLDNKDTVSYSLTGADADLFNIDANTGVVTLKASANYEAKASYQINVVATDFAGATGSKAVTINVTNVNEAPRITSSESSHVAENAATSTVVYQVTATDQDAGTVLSYSLSGEDADLFNIDASTGAVTLKASANYEAKQNYSLIVVATDNGTGNLQHSKPIAIIVDDVNEAPVVTASSTRLEAGTVVTLTTDMLAAADPELGAVHFQLVAEPDHGTVKLNGVALSAGDTFTAADIKAGKVVFLDDSGTAGQHTVQLAALDAANNATAFNLNVEVTPVNFAPVLSEFNAVTSYTEGGAAVVLDSSVGIVDDQASLKNGYVRISITENLSNSDHLGLPAGVLNGNQVIVGGKLIGTIDATENGTNGQALKILFANSADVTTIAVRNLLQQVNYRGDDAANGVTTKTVTFEVNDGAAVAKSSFATTTLNVTGVNDLPVGENASFTTNEDTPKAGKLPTAIDADGDTLTYELVPGSTLHGQVEITPDGNYMYLPNKDYNGPDSFSYVVKDGTGTSQVYTVSITINPVNDAPVLTPENGGTFTETNPEGLYTEEFTVAQFVSATPWPGETGPFTPMVGDAEQGLDIGMAITGFSLAEGAAGKVTLSYSLDNGQSWTLIPPQGLSNAHSMLLPYNAKLRYEVKDADFNGNGYTITYRAWDGTSGTAGETTSTEANGFGTAFSANTQTIHQNVTPVNDAPTVVANASVDKTITEDDTVTFTTGELLAKFADVDGNHTLTIDSVTIGGVPVIAKDGNYTYTPVKDANGQLDIVVTVKDSGNATATLSGKLTITPENDAPVLELENGGTATDSNPEGLHDETFTVAQMVGAAQWTGDTGPFHPMATDVDDGDQLGMAITNFQLAMGMAGKVSLSYLLSGSDTWISIPVDTLSNESALLLPHNAQLRYQVTDGDVNGSAFTISYRAWDGTEGTSGGLYDTTTNGGSSAFSANVQHLYENITPVNDAPVITSAATASVDENAATNTVVYTVAANDVDTADSLTYSLSGDDAALFNINASTGEVTLKAAANYESKATYSINVVATDNGTGNLSATKAVTISVNNVNEVPVISSAATASVNENAATNTVVYTVAASDQDTADTLTYSLSGDDAALFNINASTGEVTLKAAADYESKATYSINVVATDNGTGNLSASKAVTISVNNVNDAPVITSAATASVNENAATNTVVYTVAASDQDTADTLTYSLSGDDAALFNINASTGEVTLKAAADYESKATYSINVVATDNGTGNLSATKAVTISVNNVNDAPVITSAATASVNENAATNTVVYTVAASDQDTADTLTYSLSGDDAALFNINASTGEVTLKAAANYESKATYSINVVATDNGTGNLSATKAVTISVNNVNEVPVISSADTASVNENAATNTVVYTVAASDQDTADTLTYSLSGDDAALFNINASTGEVTLKAAADYESKATYSINVVATDNGTGNLSATKAVTISVNNVNDAPVITSAATASVNENAATNTVVYTVAASDQDTADTLTYSLSGDDAALFNINASTGEVTLKAAANYESKATYSINVVATDNGTGNLSATKAVTISVNNVNEVPVISSADTASVNENAATNTVVYTVAASDQDTADTLTYSLSGDDAALFNINASTGEVTLKAAADYESKATYSINVVATDNGTGNLSATKAVTISVNNVNDAPVITSAATASVNENAATNTVVYTVAASDQDTADTLTYSLSGDDAALFNINASTGEVTLKAAANYESKATYSINVVATDNGTGNLSATKAVTISVNNVNEVPVISSADTASVNENAATNTVVYTVAASDQDTADTLTYSLSGDDAALFNINASTGEVTLKAAADYESKATYSINVVATDNGTGNLSATKAVTISVNNVNDAPVITSAATASVNENAATNTVVYTVAASDQDTADTLTYSLSGDDAALFNINASTGEVTLKAAANYESKATYSINVVATDNGTGNLSATKAVTISVNNVNEVPVISSADTASVNENAATNTVVYTVAASDQDTADTLTYSLSGDDAAFFNINASTGVVTLKAAANYEDKATYSINVVATDNGTGNLSATKAVTISVNDVNEAPTLTLQGSLTLSANAANATLGTIEVGDVDGGNLTVTLSAFSGELALTGTSPLALGGSDGLWTLTGSVADINATLANLRYTANGTADDVLSISVSDGALSVEKFLNLQVGNNDTGNSYNFGADEPIDYNAITEPLFIDGVSAAGVSVSKVDGSLTLTANSHNLTLTGYAGDINGDKILFNDGSLLKYNADGKTILDGGGQNDHLIAGNSGDTLRGYAGNDLLTGGNGRDALYGGDGDDTLFGGAGNDLLVGGNGNDVFLFNLAIDNGKDLITGFGGGDKLDLGVDFGQTTGITATQSGTNVVVDLGNSHGTITLQNVTMGTNPHDWLVANTVPHAV